MKVDERQFRFYEVSFYIMAMTIIVLLSIVVYFVGEKPKMCVDYLPQEETQETTQVVPEETQPAIENDDYILYELAE